jgi:DNA modification methylase
MSEVKLYLGDCLEIMRTLPDKSVDAVITDPPYGNNTDYASYTDTQEKLSVLVPAFMEQALRIADRVVVTSGIWNMWTYPRPRWVLNWTNSAGVGSGPWGFICWQPILVYGNDPFLRDGLGRRPDTLFQRKNEVADVNHPCVKPANVMRWIVDSTTRQSESILDPFMGSGTTGVACVQTVRNFIGIEIDPGYFKIAEKRIHDAQQQMPLFSPLW